MANLIGLVCQFITFAGFHANAYSKKFLPKFESKEREFGKYYIKHNNYNI